jgi:GT2 family glycosyltransferase
MKASVIIASYGRNGCLVDTIRSVLLQEYPDFELLVVDQTANHTPEVEQFLRNVEDPRYSYFLVGPPSLPAARNFGLARATGEIVIFIDDDVDLEPHFIQNHVNVYAGKDDIASVGGRVRCPNQAVSSRLPFFLSDGSWGGSHNFPNEGELETLIGCNMSFRRSILGKIGGFDTSYDGNALCEESDVTRRLRRQGYRTYYTPLAVLDHLCAPAGGCRESDNRYNSSHYYQNLTRFIIKSFGFWSFCIFLTKNFQNYVWPHKFGLLFRPRLKALSYGVLRGIWLLFFPLNLRSKVVWELNHAQRVRVPERW